MSPATRDRLPAPPLALTGRPSCAVPLSGRIDVSVVVPEQASAAAADSPQTPPASLDAVTIAARTILGNLQLNIPQADARVPLVVSALTNHGIAEGASRLPFLAAQRPMLTAVFPRVSSRSDASLDLPGPR